MPIKLTAAQYKIIGIAIVVAAVSLGISLKYFGRAFPEAAIEIRVNRNESTPLAGKFLAARGFHVEGYRHAAIFNYDDDTKLYLERTQGLERMDQLTHGPIHLWRWSHRWFRPQQKEEFRVDVSPTGEVVGFDHEIPEAEVGANLDQPAARAIAEQFLSGAMKRDLSDLEFVEGEANKRPERTDYTFTWKQKSVDLGDGSLRLEVGVDGDQVSGLSEYVKVPEQWSRDYEKLRSRNTSAQIVDEVFWILLSVVMLALLVMRLRDRDVPRRLAVGFGLTATVLYLLSQANSFSLTQFGYPTTDSYSSFVTEYLGSSLLEALGVGTLFFLLVLASEPAYREAFPRLVSMRRTFTWQGLRTRSFFMANVAGIALTFFFFAYQTVFYLAANKLGAWAPSEPKFSNDLNTRMPWVSAVFIGYIAAVSEEMQFRAFAIPFLKKLTRSWPLALVLSAFNWGFLHSAYPNQPFFIRGVEVGIGGIIIGVIMLRFGIVATLIWHYSVDALYTAFLLLRSPNRYLIISGAITAGIMLVPLITAAIAYWRSGTFTDEAPLTNASEGVHRAPAPAEAARAPEAAVSYRPLDARRLPLAGILVVVFAVIASIPVYRFARGIKVRLNHPQAVQTAEQFLKQRRISVEDYRRVAWLDENLDPLALRYLFERRSVEQAEQIYRQAMPLLLWQVRYFRPLEKEEHVVSVDAASGQVFAYRHLLDENAPGATLSQDAARALAEKALIDNGYSLAAFELQDSEAEKRKAREDYTFTWQAKAGDPRNVGDEHYRVRVEIAGDQVVAVSRVFKLPEDWVRERQGTGLANAILIGIASLVGIGLAGGAVILFVREVRAGRIRWRASLKPGVFLAVVTLLGELDRLTLIDRNYPTSIPLSSYRLLVVVSFVILPLLVGLASWLLVGLATSLYPDAWAVLRASARRVWCRDAAVAMVVSLAAAAALVRLETLVSDRFHALAPVKIDLIPDLFDATWPGAAYLLQGGVHGILYAAAAAVVIYLVRWGWMHRAWWFWAGGVVLLVSLGPTRAHSVREFLLGWAMGLVALLVTVGIVAAFFRNNVLAYVGAAFCFGVAEPLVALLSQPPGFFRWNGIALAVLTAVTLWWLLVPGRPSADAES
ncbi:MAG TPA: CPBP family intramembrane glutamic endopeptidase [Terriglobia bacterium]|nr:CPBP family intramembrane glutamic endopeptidase [Terriglobia bacterium]